MDISVQEALLLLFSSVDWQFLKIFDWILKLKGKWLSLNSKNKYYKEYVHLKCLNIPY